MALQFGKRKSQNIIGDKGTGFVVEIWEKDYADKEPDGTDTLYPGPNSLARTFANATGFNFYWNQAAGWSWNSSGGVGAARHTPGGSGLPLIWQYNSSTDAVISGVKYEVTITIANMTTGAILVKLGSAVSSALSTNGTHTFNLTANGTTLSLDPTSQFNGDVQLIELKRYFKPTQEFNMQGEGFTITWNGQGGTRNRTFLGSECVINYLVKDAEEEKFLLQTLNNGYNYFFIRIYKSGNLDWFGWVQPAFDQIENIGFPYLYKLTSTDSYGFYGKGDKEYFANETEKRSLHYIKDIFCDFMNDMKITDGINGPAPENYRPVRTSMDWWRPGDYSTTTDPAATYKIAKGAVSPPTTMTDENLIDPSNNPFEYLPYDVLNEVLKATNMVGFLAGGKYNFIQPNSLVDNATGTLKVFEYLNNDDINYDLNTIEPLYASGFDNNLLEGSSLNYEPALKKVSANHIGGFSNFSISQGQNLTSTFLCGSIQSTQNGELQFDFYAKHRERIDKDDITFTNSNFTIIDGSVLSTGILKIFINDGTTTKYLTAGNGNNVLGWSTGPASITLYRGYAAAMDSPVNNNTMAIGLITNNEPTNQFGTSYGPTSLTSVSSFSSLHDYTTKFRISAIVEDPGISGQIYLEFDASNNYFEAKKTAVGGGAFSDYSWEYNNVGNPTPTQIETECESITLVPVEDNSALDLDVSNGIIYTASQNEVNALENLDLGNLPIGQSVINTLYSFMYEGTYIWLPINGFQRGNPTPDNPFNATQLLVNEFLELQKEPLEILQGTIKSATISPLSLVRYDYNNDGAYRYYSFLGGKFSAASETLTGEWFKISTLATTPVQVEDTTIYNPWEDQDDNPEGGKHSINKVETIQINTIKQNALGFTDAVIIHQSTPDKIELDANNRGKVYDNQKLVLTYPDGSRPLILTVNGDQEITSDQVNVDAFTPKISYPIGSILSTLVYDFTNVITGGGSSLANLYQGITTQYIYLKPDDFLTTSGTTFKMYTRDNAASVQPSAYVNRTSVFAMFWTPADYEVTAVDVYGANNRTFNLKEGVHSSSSSINIQTGGTMNTTMTLTSAHEFVVGKYGIIEVQFAASSDKIYGARITIQAV